MIATKKTWPKDKAEGQQGKKKLKHNEAEMFLKEKKIAEF